MILGRHPFDTWNISDKMMNISSIRVPWSAVEQETLLEDLKDEGVRVSDMALLTTNLNLAK